MIFEWVEAIKQTINNKKAFFVSFLDQGFYSTSNFIFGLLIYKILGLNTYGKFATSYSVFLLCMFLFYATIIEPVSVLGVSKNIKQKENYFTYTAVYFLFFLLFISIPIFLFDYIINKSTHINSILVPLSVFIASGTNFFLVYLKRYSYNINQQKKSLISSIIYSCALLFIYFVLYYYSASFFSKQNPDIQIGILFFAISLCSLISLVPFGGYLITLFSFIKQYTFKHLVKISKFNLAIGRWMFLNAIVVWCIKYFYSNYIGLTQNFELTGLVKIGENYFLPIEQIISIVGVLTLPNAIKLKNNNHAVNYIRNRSWQLIYSTIAYVLIVLFFLSDLTIFLFDSRANHTSLSLLVISFGFLTVARIVSDFYFGLQFRMNKMHSYLLISSSLAFLISIIPAFILINKYGIVGISYTFFISGIFQVGVCVILRRYTKKIRENQIVC